MTMRTWMVVAVGVGLSVSGLGLAQDAGTPKPAAKAKASKDAGKLVTATTVVTDLVEDLRYATADNFLKKKVYPDTARCLLLPESAERLKKAADVLRPKGYRLKVYDCYRPRAVQYEMWKIMPVPGYVADPVKGSNHNRGGAVDLTLVTLDGKDVEMPTPFDTFSPAAHHGYEGGTEASRQHREILREAMEGAGFTPNRMEWWHYDLPDAKTRPVLDVPFDAPKAP
ncbi:M15 family metallopeptidase [Pyxidicoccus caerfyrddinensis]|uniref:M15 family metallopeptidase n=1 Tax=Pyxidicoccus caerfyrddinensis TaxID=2709663 RepID=UPI0013D9A42C|nr:M15 family metallopeptidase [Pyxidicoccus caerfyrddinensis]